MKSFLYMLGYLHSCVGIALGLALIMTGSCIQSSRYVIYGVLSIYGFGFLAWRFLAMELGKKFFPKWDEK